MFLRGIKQQNVFSGGLLDTESAALWSHKGGRGEGVRALDIEKGYFPQHSAFNNKKFFVSELVRFKANPEEIQTYHGTAVLSIIGGQGGMRGLAPNAQLGFLSYYSRFVAMPRIRDYSQLAVTIRDHLVPTLQTAQKNLRPGDVLLVEVQVPIADPVNGILPGSTVPPTYYHSVRTVLNQISESGVHVVIPAGNMGVSLDHPALNGRFDRSLHSNIIYIGSVEQQGQSLVRLATSNYGSIVDAYGPGRKVFAADTRSLESMNDFAAFFGGTSSAGAVAAGVVTQLSGIAKANDRLISPSLMRKSLGLGRSVLPIKDSATAEDIGYISGLKAAQKLQLNKDSEN